MEKHGDGSKPWYLVNPKIASKWMFIPLKMVLIGIDPYPHLDLHNFPSCQLQRTSPTLGFLAGAGLGRPGCARLSPRLQATKIYISAAPVVV